VATLRGLLALALFVPFALIMFRRLPRAKAAAVTVIVGTAFLPGRTAFSVPVILALDKEYLIYLATLLAAFVSQRRSLIAAGPGRGLESVVVLLWILNAATMLSNTDPMMDEAAFERDSGPTRCW
jgi:hypothetical protein